MTNRVNFRQFQKTDVYIKSSAVSVKFDGRQTLNITVGLLHFCSVCHLCNLLTT